MSGHAEQHRRHRLAAAWTFGGVAVFRCIGSLVVLVLVLLNLAHRLPRAGLAML